MEEKQFVLVTDSDTDITPEVAAEYGYHVISMPYSIGEKEVYPYKDFETFDDHAFYETLRRGALPKTAALSPAEYEAFFEPFFKEGKDALYVHFSAAMSGTFNALHIAQERLKEKYPDRTIYTVDTKGITICSYIIVREIGDMYLAGKNIEEILEWAKTEVDHYAVYFFANDLKFFRRSGRVKALAAVMGNLIGIRPIITMGADGMMASVNKAVGMNKTLDKIMEYVLSLQDDVKGHRVIIGHADARAVAEQLGKKMKEQFGEDLKIEYVAVNPTAGSHCGPDTVGVAFHAIHR